MGPNVFDNPLHNHAADSVFEGCCSLLVSATGTKVPREYGATAFCRRRGHPIYGIMAIQPAVKAKDLILELDKYDSSVIVADDFSLRKFKREADVLLKALPHESTVLSAFVHIAALARDAAAVLDAIRVGNQRQFGKPSIDFRLNSATALFSVAEFDQFEEVIEALISDFPNDTDVAYIAWTSYVLMGMPRRALTSLKVRRRANIDGGCDEGNVVQDLECISAFLDRQNISDEEATLVARPLLRHIAKRTHQMGNTTFLLQLQQSEQDRTARLILYPEVGHEQIPEILNDYFDELGTTSLPWNLLSSFSVDIYGIRKEHAQLAA